jgi:hypothetical protein
MSGTASQLPPPRSVFYDANGNPLSGGTVATYVPNTTTAKTTWQDAGEATANANPITLDANGSCLLYGSGEYQLTVADSLGNAVPAYSGVTYSQPYISSAMSAVVAAASVAAALNLMVATNPLTQTATGQFYQEYGATIDRLNDRVFIGAATVNSGNPSGVGAQDWLESLIPLTTSIATFASIAQIGNTGILAATRSSDAPSSILDNFAGAFFGVNDNTTQSNTVTSIYAETRHTNGAHQTIGTELDIIPLAGTSAGTSQPYNIYSTMITANLWLSCGKPGVSGANATVAVGILNNSGGTTSGQYTKGIVFDANALVGTTASTPGASCAIAMANGQQIQWFDVSGNVAASISSVASATSPVGIAFGSSGVSFFTQGSANVLELGSVSSAVNFVEVLNAATASPPQILAQGSDTNIDLELVPKGTGLVRFGTYTTGSLSQTGYIQIKDASGTIHNVMVGS